MTKNEKTLEKCGGMSLCKTTIHRTGQSPVTLELPVLLAPADAPWTLGIDVQDTDGAEFDAEASATGCYRVVVMFDWTTPWSDLNVHSIPGDCNRPEVVK